jgi:signal transduction histidine kinase
MPSFSMNQLLESQRWQNFLESTAIGLQLNLTIMTKAGFNLQVPQVCPTCHAEFKKVNRRDREKIFSSRNDNLKGVQFPRDACFPRETQFPRGTEFIDSHGNISYLISLANEIWLVVRGCPCIREKGLPSLEQRAVIAQKLLNSFLVTLSEEIIGSQLNVELSALRQMNRIILSLFRDENSSTEPVFDLILSALVIMLDAEASWLEYHDGNQTRLFVKGNREIIDEYLQSHMENVDALVTEVNCGQIRGRLGVFLSGDPVRAAKLLPMMAQECTIVFEIENLFRALQAKVSRILEAVRSAILLMDNQCNLVYLNHAAEELLAKPATFLVGTPVTQLNAPWNPYLKSKPTEPISRFKVNLERAGVFRLIDWQLLPIREQSSYGGWLIIADDRTEFYHWQEFGWQAENNSLIASVIGPLAHELRNPLAATKGLLQLVCRKKESEKTTSYLELILQEIDRMSLLVNEFLQLGRSTHAKFENMDLIVLLQELMPILKSEAFHNEIKIIQELEPVQPIIADRNQIIQVILNLVRNAIEAIGTREKGVIRIKLCQNEEWVILEVQDNGSGLKPEVMSKLYRPFFTTKDRGTGLGLAVTKNIITNHGGRILATNMPGEGALFRIKLPIRDQKQVNAHMVDVIITVSDEMICYPLEQVLQAAGFTTVIVNPLTEVLNKSKAPYDPAVIVLDATIEPADFDKLQKIWPKTKKVMVGEPLYITETPEITFLATPLNYAQFIEEIRLMMEKPIRCDR